MFCKFNEKCNKVLIYYFILLIVVSYNSKTSQKLVNNEYIYNFIQLLYFYFKLCIEQKFRTIIYKKLYKKQILLFLTVELANFINFQTIILITPNTHLKVLKYKANKYIFLYY